MAVFKRVGSLADTTLNTAEQGIHHSGSMIITTFSAMDSLAQEIAVDSKADLETAQNSARKRIIESRVDMLTFRHEKAKELKQLGFNDEDIADMLNITL
jgi:DNA-directed RNA polymerase specialized sigma24 family protein